VFTRTGKKMKTFINEGNLYRLIGRSDKPQAEKFQDWVDFEVLPSIRKTGSYSVPGAKASGGQKEASTLEQRVRMMINLEEVEIKVSAFRVKELEGQNLSHLILCLLKSKVFCPCQSASNFFPW
jgi:prophage antirepressor-like protein